MSSLVVVISGPGGVGKSTVVADLIAKYPDIWLSRSWTTRARRPSESEDAYVFVPQEVFEEKIAQNGFWEYTNFLGNYYGTPVPDDDLGKDILLEIEVHGARQVVSANADALLIFLEAPSQEEQHMRLKKRGDSPEKIVQRLEKSAEEADAGRELGAQIVVNHDIDDTVEKIWKIIQQAKV